MLKRKDFEILSTLPDEYEYDFFTFNDKKAVMGKNNQTIIGFYIEDDRLIPIKFENKQLCNPI